MDPSTETHIPLSPGGGKTRVDFVVDDDQNVFRPGDNTKNDEKQEARHARGSSRRHTKQRSQKYAGRPENQPFVDALRTAMDKAGFSPSDLARAAWGSTTNKRGNSVARGRDRIGHYLAGTSYPTPENLQLLADALGIPVETLMIDRPTGSPKALQAPRAASSAASATASAGTLSQTSLPAQPSKIRLQVDRVIHWRLAEHIHRLLKEAETGEVTTVDETTLGEIVGGTDTEAQADISDAK